MPQLPKHGIMAVVEGLPGFTNAMNSVNKQIEKAGKVADGATRKVSPLGKAFDNAQVGIGQFSVKLKDLLQNAGPVGQAISGVLDKIVAIPPAAAAAAIGIALIVKGLIDLAQRGAGLRGLAESFDSLTSSIGIVSTTLLTDLRRASAGTVSDFELIRLANVALAGASGQFGQEFGRKLPQLLEIARAQARATGQDVNFLFQSLITGIKRGSPLLIDNTGLVLSVTEAQRAYAESIGKSVSQLSEEEKQIALLNATLEAGQSSIDRAAAFQETAAEKSARAQATITNILDKLALAVQPAFEMVLDVINRVLSAVDQLVTALLPVFQAIMTNLVQPFSTAANAVLDFVQPFVNLAANILPYLIAVGQVISNVFNGIISFIGSLIQPIVQPILDAFGRIGQFISNPENVRAFFQGGARMIGALANGILAAANQYVFPAVIQIATFIADFLVGLSPPPKGPLHEIDKGGANTMMAWLEGFSGVSLEPVSKVAGEVTAALGNIGQMGAAAVEKRLFQLDRALQPFSDRLEIVKSQFEAIQEPADAALRAIDRQMEKAVDTLLQGDEQAAATVRALDAQRAAIEGAVDAQQELVDKAQLQFSLAKAQQAQERTLLEIRKRMLGTPAAAKAGKKSSGAGEKPPKEEKPKAGEAQTPEVAGGPVALEGETPSVLDLIGGQQAVDDAMAALQEGFAQGLDPSTVAEFQSNSAALQTQIGRIGGALGEFDLGERIIEGVNAAFDPVKTFFTGTGEGTLSGMIDAGVQFFRDLPTRLPEALSQLQSNLDISIITPLRNFLAGGGGLGGSIPSLPGMITSAVGFFREMPGRIVAELGNLAGTLFNNEDAPFHGVITFLSGQTDDATSLHGILSMALTSITGWPQQIIDNVGDIWETLSTGEGPFAGIVSFFSGTGEGTLQGLIDSAANIFQTLPDELVAALEGFGQIAWANVAVPVISAINGIITAVQTALNAIRNAAAAILDDNADLLNAAFSLIPGFAGFDSHSWAAALRRNNISLTTLSLEMPSFLTGAATGGMFSKGTLRVGEAGEEIISSASRMAVFPNNFVTAVESLTAVLTDIVAQPAPMPMPVGGNSYSDNHSMTINQYGVEGSQDSARRFRVMRAMGR